VEVAAFCRTSRGGLGVEGGLETEDFDEGLKLMVFKLRVNAPVDM
jgi:hypothetical protein